MWELLQKLEDLWWKPYWKNIAELTETEKNVRLLTSLSSWLWQFVCDREHRFIDKKNYEGTRLDKRLKNPYADYDDVNTEYEWITGLDYKYWVIESSLKDESELEDFLLSNIKVWNED